MFQKLVVWRRLHLWELAGEVWSSEHIQDVEVDVVDVDTHTDAAVAVPKLGS